MRPYSPLIGRRLGLGMLIKFASCRVHPWGGPACSRAPRHGDGRATQMQDFGPAVKCGTQAWSCTARTARAHGLSATLTAWPSPGTMRHWHKPADETSVNVVKSARLVGQRGTRDLLCWLLAWYSGQPAGRLRRRRRKVRIEKKLVFPPEIERKEKSKTPTDPITKTLESRCS